MEVLLLILALPCQQGRTFRYFPVPFSGLRTGQAVFIELIPFRFRLFRIQSKFSATIVHHDGFRLSEFEGHSPFDVISYCGNHRPKQFSINIRV